MSLTRRTLAVTALLLAAGRQAQAHARLRTASPAPGSMLDGPAPTEVSITFSEALEPKFSTIEVTDSAKARVDAGPAHLGADAKTLVVPLKPLEADVYTVVWHATSVDTHKTEGSFTFMLHG
jgi:methionine-rich copper-binding protein CopC